MPGFWRKTLVYLGLAEDDEYDDQYYDDLADPEAEGAAPRRAPVRRLADHDRARGPRDPVVRPIPSGGSRFHLVQPTAFNDVQEVGDKYREGFSVLMNLQAADADLRRRLVDFASGLAYAFGGTLQPVAERVFLVTPPGVVVSAEERRRFLEERGFFNQA
jgi:cell division inhibitor SepF